MILRTLLSAAVVLCGFVSSAQEDIQQLLNSFGENKAVISPGPLNYYTLSEGGELKKKFGTIKIHVNYEYSSYKDWMYKDQKEGKLLLKWIQEYEEKIAANPSFKVDTITLLKTYHYGMISYRESGTDNYRLMSTFFSGQDEDENDQGSFDDLKKDKMDYWWRLLDSLNQNGSLSSSGSKFFSPSLDYMVYTEFPQAYSFRFGQSNTSTEPPPPPSSAVHTRVKVFAYRGGDYELNDPEIDICKESHNIVTYFNGYFYSCVYSNDGNLSIEKYDMDGGLVDIVNEDVSEGEIYIPTVSRYFIKVNTQDKAVQLYEYDGTPIFTSILTTDEEVSKLVEQQYNRVCVTLKIDGFILTSQSNPATPTEVKRNQLNVHGRPSGENNTIYVGSIAYNSENETLRFYYLQDDCTYKEIETTEGTIINPPFNLMTLWAFGWYESKEEEILWLIQSKLNKVESKINLSTVSATVKNLPDSYKDSKVTGKLLEVIHKNNDPGEVYEVIRYKGLNKPIIGTRSEYLVLLPNDENLYRIPRVKVGQGQDAKCIERYVVSSVHRLKENRRDLVASDGMLEEVDGILRVKYRKSGTVLFAHREGRTRELVPFPENLIPNNPRALVDGMMNLEIETIELYQKDGQKYAIDAASLNTVSETSFNTIFSYETGVAPQISKRIIDDFSGSWNDYSQETFKTSITNGVLVSCSGKKQNAYWKSRSPTASVLKISSQDFTLLRAREKYWKDLFKEFGEEENTDLNLITVGRYNVLTNSETCYLWLRDDGTVSFPKLGEGYNRSIHTLMQKNFSAFLAENNTLTPYSSVKSSPSCSNEKWLAMKYDSKNHHLIVSEADKQLRIVNFNTYATDCQVWNTAFNHENILKSPQFVNKLPQALYSYTPGGTIYRLSDNANRVGQYSEVVNDELLTAMLVRLEEARQWKKEDILTSMTSISSENEMLQASMHYFDGNKIDVLLFPGSGGIEHVFLTENSKLSDPPEILKQLNSYRPVNSSYIWEIFPLESGTFAYTLDTLHILHEDVTKSRKIEKIVVPRNYPTLVEEFFNTLAQAANANPNFKIEKSFCLCSPEDRYPATVTRLLEPSDEYQIITMDNPSNPPLHYTIKNAPHHLEVEETDGKIEGYVGSIIDVLVNSSGTDEAYSERTQDNAESIITRVSKEYYHWVPENEKQRRLFGMNRMELSMFDERNLFNYLSDNLGTNTSESFEYREYFTNSEEDVPHDPILVVRAESDDIFKGYQKDEIFESHPAYHTSELDSIHNLSEDYWGWISSNPDVGKYSFNKNGGKKPYILASEQLVRFSSKNDYRAVYYRYGDFVDSSDVKLGRNYLSKLLSLAISPGESVTLFGMSRKGFAVISDHSLTYRKYYVQQQSQIANGWSISPRNIGYFAPKLKRELQGDPEIVELQKEDFDNGIAELILKTYWQSYFSSSGFSDSKDDITVKFNYGVLETYEFTQPLVVILYGNGSN